MPPKAKLHSKHGKLKSFQRGSETSSSLPSPALHSSASTSSSSAPETSIDNSDQQSQAELLWCIHQLEESLSNNKLNPKQAQESTNILKTLKSKTQPLVRKRQLMRMYFGDYRSKMVAEEKKAKKVQNQISFKSDNNLGNKSTFLRKSAILSTGNNSFKFNFQPQVEDEIGKTDDLQTTEPIKKDDVALIKNDLSKLNLGSNKEFKFNFAIDKL